jgi:thiol-disulfide isomerase/thioredoxin
VARGIAVSVLLVVAAAAAVTLGVPVQAPEAKPQLHLQTLRHGELTSQSLRGKAVLITFWATTCTVCLSEMPGLVDLYDRYRAKGFEIVAVAMPYDAAWLVADYATSRALPFPVAFDAAGSAVEAFGKVDATPTAFLLDTRGAVLERIRGRPDFARLQTRIERLLAQG